MIITITMTKKEQTVTIPLYYSRAAQSWAHPGKVCGKAVHKASCISVHPMLSQKSTEKIKRNKQSKNY